MRNRWRNLVPVVVLAGLGFGSAGCQLSVGYTPPTTGTGSEAPLTTTPTTTPTLAPTTTAPTTTAPTTTAPTTTAPTTTTTTVPSGSGWFSGGDGWFSGGDGWFSGWR